MSGNHRRDSRVKRRAGLVGLVVALILVVGQSGLMVASAGTSDRSREPGSTGETGVVTEGVAGSGGGGTAIPARSTRSDGGLGPAPLAAGANKVTVKWFGQSPTTYNHTTGAQTTGSSSNTVPELEAEDFDCLDKVAYYAIFEGGGGLVGANATSVTLNFAKKTTSNEAFGFSAGVSYALETGGVSNRDGGEGLSPASPAGFDNSAATHVTLSFTLSDVEKDEVIPVRILVTLGNCGPGATTGNVHATVDTATTVDNVGGSVQTSGGNQTVPLKFQGKPTGTITIVKDLVPAADSGTFNLQLQGNTLATGGDGTTTGAQAMLQGTYAIGETAAGGTNLADYNSEIVCQNGTQSALAPVVGTSTNVTVVGGDSWVCTITNTRVIVPPATGTITVNKVLSPTTDPGKFNLQIDGKTSGADVGNGGTTGAITVSAGSHSVGETAGTGTSLGNYDSQIVCQNGTQPALAAVVGTSTNVTVAAGDAWVCTITNTLKTTPPPPPPPPAAGAIQIDKSGPAQAHVGDTITYSFAVSLVAGSPGVNSVSVSDPKCDVGTLSAPTKTGGDQDTTLEQGEVWNYSCTHVVTASDADPLPNTATASGVDVNGHAVSDTDSHQVDIIHPEITITKTANPTQGSPGERIRYTYKVKNSGDVTLTDVSVNDDVLGHICDIPQLDPGETATCSASYVIPEDAGITVTNVATAAGTDPLGLKVRDQDDATIDVVLGATVTPTKTPPGGVAFTGTAAAIPLGGIALLFLTVGTALMWAGRRRGKHTAQ